MKFELSFLKKIQHVPFGTKTGAPRPSIYPVREWGVSLLVTVLIACGLFGLGGLDFYRQYTDSDKPEVTEEHIPRYRAQDADSLILYFDGRQKAFDTLRKKTYAPSFVSEVPVVANATTTE